MPYKMQTIGKDTKFKPIMNRTYFKGTERLLTTNIARVLMKGSIASRLVEQLGDRRGKISDVARKAMGDGRKVEILGGITSTVEGRKRKPILVSPTGGPVSKRGIIALTPGRNNRVEVEGAVSSVFSNRDIGEGADISFSGHGIFATLTDGFSQDPHNQPFKVDIRHSNGKLAFSDIESHTAWFVSERHHFDIAVMTLFGEFSTVILKDSAEPEYFGSNAPREKSKGTLFADTDRTTVPGVITISIYHLKKDGKTITVADSLIAMEHRNGLYVGNIREATSLNKGDYGVLFVGQRDPELKQKLGC